MTDFIRPSRKVRPRRDRSDPRFETRAIRRGRAGGDIKKGCHPARPRTVVNLSTSRAPAPRAPSRLAATRPSADLVLGQVDRLLGRQGRVETEDHGLAPLSRTTRPRCAGDITPSTPTSKGRTTTVRSPGWFQPPRVYPRGRTQAPKHSEPSGVCLRLCLTRFCVSGRLWLPSTARRS